MHSDSCARRPQRTHDPVQELHIGCLRLIYYLCAGQELHSTIIRGEIAVQRLRKGRLEKYCELEIDCKIS